MPGFKVLLLLLVCCVLSCQDQALKTGRTAIVADPSCPCEGQWPGIAACAIIGGMRIQSIEGFATSESQHPCDASRWPRVPAASVGQLQLIEETGYVTLSELRRSCGATCRKCNPRSRFTLTVVEVSHCEADVEAKIPMNRKSIVRAPCSATHMLRIRACTLTHADDLPISSVPTGQLRLL